MSDTGLSTASARRVHRENDGRGETVSDEELLVLALGSDPDQPLAQDAIPLSAYLGQSPGLLPNWYMPPALMRQARGWRVPLIVALVGALLVIEALGLCSAFGQVVIG